MSSLRVKKMMVLKQKLRQLVESCLELPPKIYFWYEALLRKFTKGVGARVRQSLIDKIDSEVKEVEHRALSKTVRFILHTPNRMCDYRHRTFSEKEPEMLEWIEEYGGDGALYDIGANIGIYSLYYAKIKSGNVYSFEPSIFNLRQLAKNISINSLSDRITIISNPLSNRTGISTFINSNEDEGGALSAFGVDYGHDGKPIISNIKYNVIGFTLDDLLKTEVIAEPPSLIKIDVDGIEHLILNGALKTLKHNKCKTVFIEVSKNFKKQSKEIKQILIENDFELKESLQTSIEIGTYNQIWTKTSS